jgi:hypothetical protein
MANSRALTPMIPVSTSISADRRSTTSTRPNGTCQLPGRYTPMEPGTPVVCVHCSSITEMPRPSRLENRLILALSGRCFSPSINMIAAVSSGSRIGAAIRCVIAFIL